MLVGHMVWVGMSRGRFVGGRNVKAPDIQYVGNVAQLAELQHCGNV